MLIHVSDDKVENDELELPSQIDCIVLLSPAAVRIWYERYHHPDRYRNTKYGVIGETTKEAVQSYGGTVDYMPQVPSFHELVELIREN